VPDTRFADLLDPGDRIFYDTHVRPLLHMQGEVREIAVDVLRDDGSAMPALINVVLRSDASGSPAAIRITIFDASDRRRYEDELRRGRDRERHIARRLQESFLRQAAEDPSLPTGVAYLPSSGDMQIGGDWYDVFPVDGDRTALVVGDVVGRGLEAAATMGQLRSAVRALATTGAGPGALLGSLDTYAHRHDVGRMATVAYLEIDVRHGVLRMACAGHMPPALVAPGVAAQYLLEGRSAPLDAYLAPMPRPEAEVRLPDEALLVLFTDGLVERVGRPLDEGLNTLLDQIQRLAGAAPGDVAARVAETMLVDRDVKDDVCVLAARWGGDARGTAAQ
jgi:serine phosphatase RsbU (regulator of sigma subunit)